MSFSDISSSQMILNLICPSHPNTVCDSPAGIWLISLLKYLTPSLLNVFSPCFGKFSHYRFTNLESESSELSPFTVAQWNYKESYQWKHNPLHEQNYSRLSPLAPRRPIRTGRSSLKLSSDEGQHMENIITIIMIKMTKKSFNFLGGLPKVEKKYNFSLPVGFVQSE